MGENAAGELRNQWGPSPYCPLELILCPCTHTRLSHIRGEMARTEEGWAPSATRQCPFC